MRGSVNGDWNVAIVQIKGADDCFYIEHGQEVCPLTPTLSHQGRGEIMYET
jgi:hypothetical protein